MSVSNPHRLYLLHALTPLHVGGESGSGGIDLPTLRERHTGYPLVPGSSVKGVLREEAEEHAPESVVGAFGPDHTRAGEHRGGLILTDALLLALPVRSLFGTFAWLTCPLALGRLDRDLAVAGHAPLKGARIADLLEPDACLVAQNGDADIDSALVDNGSSAARRLFLEDLDLEPRGAARITALAEQLGSWLWPRDEEGAEATFFRRRLAVAHDDVFGYFTRLALEVRSRVKIDRKTGTAAETGPWTEEHIPAEAILAGLAVGRRTYVQRGKDGDQNRSDGETWLPQRSLEVLATVAGSGPVLRFGGNASIGLGRARMRLA